MPGTQITGGDPMSQAFAPIYQMIGGGGVRGGGTGSFGLQPQPVGAGDNDLTQALRASTNLLGQTGAQLGQLGQSVLGGGLAGVQQGMGVMGQGIDVMGTGLQTLQPSIDFYSKLLSGDPTATTQALAPTAANIAAITSGATNQATQGMPGGGYRAATLAGLPFAQASQVGNAALQLQPAAAQALGVLGGEQAQIGQGIAGAGQGMGQLGIGVGGLGTQLTGQGGQFLDAATRDYLQKMQINLQEPSIFQDIMGSIGAVGQLAGGIGGMMTGINLGGLFGGSGGGSGGYARGWAPGQAPGQG